MKMSKRHAHSAWSKFKPLNPWYLLILAGISGFICVVAMRQNNLQMIKLRDQVFAADKDNGDVEKALRELRTYVYAHMNTNLSSSNGIKPPIQLKYRYERLVKAEKDRVSQANAKIYNDAQKHCESQISRQVFGGAKISCVKDYVSSHGIKESAVPDGLYKFDFVSPAWSADLAGISMLAAIIFLLLFVVRFGLEKWARHDLRE